MTKPSDYIIKGWCQDVAAKDNSGQCCMPDAPYATQWCLVGAMVATYPERNEYRSRITSKLQMKLKSLQFAAWNDDPKRTQAEVVALLQSIGE